MKTKYFTGLAAGVLMATAAASCNDFLETHPTTQVSEAEYYKTEYEVQMGLNAVIADVKVRLLEIWAYSSILSDESATGGGLGEGIYKEKFDKFLYNPNNCFGSWGYGSWWNEWDFGIYNGVIDAALLIDKLEDSPLPESFTKPVEAEARFFRALFYSYLFMGYEQFPLIKHYITADEMYNVTKGTRQEIYDFMMEDLADEWIALLPDRGAIVEGRICKDAARVLRAKIALFHRSEADYARCLTDMKTIIGSGVYQLDPDYKHLWLKDGEWGKENIYNVPAGSTNDTGMGFVHGLGGRDLQDPRSAAWAPWESGHAIPCKFWLQYCRCNRCARTGYMGAENGGNLYVLGSSLRLYLGGSRACVFHLFRAGRGAYRIPAFCCFGASPAAYGACIREMLPYRVGQDGADHGTSAVPQGAVGEPVPQFGQEDGGGIQAGHPHRDGCACHHVGAFLYGRWEFDWECSLSDRKRDRTRDHVVWTALADIYRMDCFHDGEGRRARRSWRCVQ